MGLTDRFEVLSPVDGKPIFTRPYANGSEIEDLLVSSVNAKKSWTSTSLSERVSLLNKALEYFLDHATEIAEELTEQMGRPIKYSPFEITGGFADRARTMCSVAEQALSSIHIESSSSVRRYIRKEPVGTVLVLAPWNYPYLTSVNAIWPALLAGNTVILKHATQTALCAERYQKAFDFAGLPVGAFQHIHITHDQTSLVIQDHRINHVCFTGSVEGGHAVKRAASSRFIPTTMELGGKDAAYVLSDAVLESTVEHLVDGAFFNSGQSCCGIERIYVDRTIFDDFIDLFAAKTREYIVGNPSDPNVTLGPMVNLKGSYRVQTHIDQALSSGAKALISEYEIPVEHEYGTFVRPQVLIDVNHEMDVMKEETFGPVVGIMPVSSEEEAIHLVNDSKYGLTSSVWSEDIERAEHMSRQIQAGTVFLNRCDYLDPMLAWTGLKDSGNGVSLSVLGFQQMVQAKSIHFRKLAT